MQHEPCTCGRMGVTSVCIRCRAGCMEDIGVTNCICISLRLRECLTCRSININITCKFKCPNHIYVCLATCWPNMSRTISYFVGHLWIQGDRHVHCAALVCYCCHVCFRSYATAMHLGIWVSPVVFFEFLWGMHVLSLRYHVRSHRRLEDLIALRRQLSWSPLFCEGVSVAFVG